MGWGSWMGLAVMGALLLWLLGVGKKINPVVLRS